MKLRLIALWSSVLALLLIMAAGLIIERQATEERMALSVKGYARLLAEHAGGIVRSAELAAQGVMNDPRILFQLSQAAHTDTSPSAPESNRILLQSFLRNLPGAINIFIADTNGLVLSSATSVPDGTRIHERSYFRSLAAAHGNSTAISDTVRGKTSAEWAIQVARRVEDGNGRFLGVVVVSLGVEEQLSKFYASIDWPTGTAISLWNAQRQLMMRYPMLPDQVGRTSSGTLLRRPGNQPFEVGPSEFDGQIRARAASRVSGYPLTAIVAVPRDIYYNAWITNLRWAGGLALLLLIAASLLTLWLRNQHRNQVALQQARQKDREQLQAYATIVETTQCGLAMIDPLERCVVANPAFARLIARDPATLAQQSLPELLPEPIRSRLRHDIGQCLRGRHSRSYHRLHTDWQDTIWEIELVPLLEHGEPVGAILSLYDVTVQYLAEEALIQREADLQAIFDSHPDCLKVFDLSGRLRRLNPASIRSLEADNLAHGLTARMEELIDPDDLADYLAFRQRILGGHRGHLRYRSRSLKGSPRHTELHAAPIRDATGTITGMVAIARDCTAGQT
ncbi:MAG: PAS domain-containing protein [Zoogloea sp.]|nr:PAS domain-containing protein [Zoogloea sp.]